ncbi:MAG: hypothetical protein ACLTEE_07995 [Anaerobutyricum hallii]
MVIGICDDDKKWRESCKRTLIGFSTMIDMGMEVMCFSTAEELLEYKETPLDAVFFRYRIRKSQWDFCCEKVK